MQTKPIINWTEYKKQESQRLANPNNDRIEDK